MPVVATLSNYAGNLALVKLLNQSGLYLAAHTADPTATGMLATEVAGGGYERLPITFSSPSGKAAANTRKAYYSGMPGCVVTHLAVWDGPSSSNMIGALQLATPITVSDGQQLRVEVGDIAFQL